MVGGMAAVAIIGGGIAFYFLKGTKSSGCDASSCPVGQVCVNRKCEMVECVADFECKGKGICEGYKCVDSICSSSKKCIQRTDKCDAGRCVPGICPTDYECLEGSICDTNTGSCVYPSDCTSKGFVCPADKVCDGFTKMCVEKPVSSQNPSPAFTMSRNLHFF